MTKTIKLTLNNSNGIDKLILSSLSKAGSSEIKALILQSLFTTKRQRIKGSYPTSIGEAGQKPKTDKKAVTAVPVIKEKLVTILKTIDESESSTKGYVKADEAPKVESSFKAKKIGDKLDGMLADFDED